MIDGVKLLALSVALAGAIALGWYLSVRNYQECRAHGFSRYYCWSQEGRQ